MDIQFRAFYIIKNLVKVNKTMATQIVCSELMDVLLAIKEMKDDRVANEKVTFKMNLKMKFHQSIIIDRFRIEILSKTLLKSVWIMVSSKRIKIE